MISSIYALKAISLTDLRDISNAIILLDNKTAPGQFADR
jgi:hypothetical protein